MKHFLLVVFLLTNISLFAVQELSISPRFYGIFDNREYEGSTLAPSQTIGGAWIGLNLKYSIDSTHHLRAGALYSGQFGVGAPHRVLPELNYEFTTKTWLLKMGFYNMDTLITELPRFLWQDSLRIAKPLFSGSMLQFRHKGYTQMAWLDWWGYQSDTTIEAFSFGLCGNYQITPFIAFKQTFMLNHIATITGGGRVRDNVGLSAGLETNLEKLWKNHSSPLVRSAICQIGVDYVFSTDRTRPEHYVLSNGVNAKISLGMWRVKLITNYYFGQGHRIYWGDLFYRPEFDEMGRRKLKHYVRGDLDLHFIKTRYVDLRVILTLHYGENDLYNQQQLVASFRIGDKTLKRFK